MAFDPDAYLATEEKKRGFDPDAYLAKTKPETALQTFGRSTASMADSALNAVTGTLDAAAYPLARAFGRSPEQAQAETTSPKDVIGRAFGVTGTQGYEQAPLRQLGNYIGEGLGENVVQPLSQATGLPEQDVGSMVNSGMMAAGAIAPKIAKPVYNAGKTAATGAVDFGKGVYGGAFNATAAPTVNPAGLKPWQTRSARMPVGENYIPADVLEQYRSGTITPEQAQQQARPITELPQAALARTQGMVPYAGEAARATGEQFGAGYRDPYKLAAEAGADYLLGGVPTLARLGMKAYDAYQLGNAYKQLGKSGFSPLTAQEFSQLQAAGPVAPNAPPPLVGPTMPGPGGLAAATPAAQAAMATTQRVAKTPTTPRAPAAPRPQPQPFTLPDAGTHYAQAEQGSANFADTFNKAVSARTADLLKNAKQTGQALSPEQAGNLAFDEIKEFRRNNVDAFKPAPEVAGPVEPTITPEQLKQELNPVKVDPELASDQRIWKMLQDKTAAGTKLVANEETAVKRITNKYGQDPFQTGNLVGESVLETPKRKNVKQETRVKEMEAERTKDMTPEQIAADEQAILDRVKRMANPNSPFNKTLRKEISSPKKSQTKQDPVEKAKQALNDLKKEVGELEKKTAEELGMSVRQIKKLTDEELIAKIQAARKGKPPAGVMKMETADNSVLSKADWNEKRLMDELAGKPTLESYIDGDKVVTHKIEGVGPFESVIRTEFDAKTGKQIGMAKRTSMKKVK